MTLRRRAIATAIEKTEWPDQEDARSNEIDKMTMIPLRHRCLLRYPQQLSLVMLERLTHRRRTVRKRMMRSSIALSTLVRVTVPLAAKRWFDRVALASRWHRWLQLYDEHDRLPFSNVGAKDRW